MRLNLHRILDRSRANGPGTRITIWFQGCTLGCPGCFNPQTHSHEPATLISVEELGDLFSHAHAEVEGVTLTGGEPLQQPAGLLALLQLVRAHTRLSVILFSGYTMREITWIPRGLAILSYVDLLVAGRYEHAHRTRHGIPGSSNQTVHLLSHRYTLSDLTAVPPAEIIIDPSGSVLVSGTHPPSPVMP